MELWQLWVYRRLIQEHKRNELLKLLRLKR
jgi:hypothetical protein